MDELLCWVYRAGPKQVEVTEPSGGLSEEFTRQVSEFIKQYLPELEALAHNKSSSGEDRPELPVAPLLVREDELTDSFRELLALPSALALACQRRIGCR